MRTAIAFLCFLLIANLCFADALYVGVSQSIITPEIGTPMAGYYYDRGAEGVHDDLYTKALVLEKDGQQIALVTCDLIKIPGYLTQEIRTRVEKETGIPGGHVMISATHAHTGPVVPSSKEDEESSHELVRTFSQKLPAIVAENVKQAQRALQPAILQAGLGSETTLSFNRRFVMRDGSVGWNPGKMNPNIVRTVGPIDPDVPVLYIETVDGTPIAAFVNFAMHLDTVGGLEYSADYPYTVSRIMSAVTSEDMVTLFTMGCSGNVNHLDFFSPKKQKGHEEAARIGTVLAGEVLKTLTRVDTIEVGTIKTKSTVIELDLAPVDASDREHAEKIIATYGTENPAPFLEMVNAFKVKDVLDRKGQPFAGEVQVIALGKDVAIVGLNGEIFVELGLAIKKSSPFPLTIISSLSNSTIGYVPDRKAYAEGNYEPVSARCAPGSGEMMVEAAVEMLYKLYQSE